MWVRVPPSPPRRPSTSRPQRKRTTQIAMSSLGSSAQNDCTDPNIACTICGSDNRRFARETSTKRSIPKRSPRSSRASVTPSVAPTKSVPASTATNACLKRWCCSSNTPTSGAVGTGRADLSARRRRSQAWSRCLRCAWLAHRRELVMGGSEGGACNDTPVRPRRLPRLMQSAALRPRAASSGRRTGCRCPCWTSHTSLRVNRAGSINSFGMQCRS